MAAMKSGDRVATGTGAHRRRLTLDEAMAGGLPDRFTAEEWAVMHRASTAHNVAAFAKLLREYHAHTESRSCIQRIRNQNAR